MFRKNTKEPNKRLLTAAEREFVLERLENRNMGVLIVIAVLLFFLLAFLVALIGPSIKILFSCLALFIFCGAIIVYYVASMNTVLRKVRANELYVAEAIYEGSLGNPNQVYLSGYKKAYGAYSGLQLAEKLEPGDKVIIIEKPGVVYKARLV